MLNEKQHEYLHFINICKMIHTAGQPKMNLKVQSYDLIYISLIYIKWDLVLCLSHLLIYNCIMCGMLHEIIARAGTGSFGVDEIFCLLAMK